VRPSGTSMFSALQVSWSVGGSFSFRHSTVPSPLRVVLMLLTVDSAAMKLRCDASCCSSKIFQYSIMLLCCQAALCHYVCPVFLVKLSLLTGALMHILITLAILLSPAKESTVCDSCGCLLYTLQEQQASENPQACFCKLPHCPG
jgi:hypothetical protein